MDLINRQAAIDGKISIQCANGVEIYSDEAVPVEYLKALPSAQPEIIRCSECKYAEVADARDNQDGYTCQFHRGSIWFSGSYCSWAERRTE